jgi:hypothetical protein
MNFDIRPPSIIFIELAKKVNPILDRRKIYLIILLIQML